MNFFKYYLPILVLLWACQGPSEQQTANGLKYTIFKTDEARRKANLGDYLALHYTMLTAQGDTIASTFSTGQTVEQQLLQPPYPGALEEGMALLREGDSVQFSIAAGKYYQGQQLPQKVKNPADELRILMLVRQVRSAQERMIAEQVETERHKPIDEEKIRQHLKERGLLGAAKRHPSGMYIYEHWAGKGEPANPGDSVVFFLHGSYLNGAAFDVHDTVPIGFVLGKTRMLPGWEIAFDEVLTEKSQYSIILPSHLAYGATGKDLIPPFTPLRFQIGVKQIVRAKGK